MQLVGRNVKLGLHIWKTPSSQSSFSAHRPESTKRMNHLLEGGRRQAYHGREKSSVPQITGTQIVRITVLYAQQ